MISYICLIILAYSLRPRKVSKITTTVEDADDANRHVKLVGFWHHHLPNTKAVTEQHVETADDGNRP